MVNLSLRLIILHMVFSRFRNQKYNGLNDNTENFAHKILPKYICLNKDLFLHRYTYF